MPRKSPWYRDRAILAAIIGGIFGIVAAVIGVIRWSSEEALPEFRLVKGVSYHPDSTIVVAPVNAPAKKNKPLGVEIEEYWFPEMVQPQKGTSGRFWAIKVPLLFGLPDTVRRDGPKVVRFGFTQERRSAPQNIYFDSQPPQAMVGYFGKHPGEKTIFGQVADKGADVQKPISVEASFRRSEQLQTLQLPVKQITDEVGRQVFEFEYQVQNFPQYTASDSEYHQPYFLLTVRDAAGNEFQQGSTYDAFAVTGEQRFGYRNAQIVLQKIEQERVAVFSETTTSSGIIHLPPDRKMANAPPVLVLRVVIRTSVYVQLSWTRLPENLRSDQEEYTVLRSSQPIGASFDTTFTDRSIMPDSTYSYQVLARGAQGLTYTSNTVPSNAVPDTTMPPPSRSYNLRVSPRTLTDDQVMQMLKERSFFDSFRNREGKGLQHQYENVERNGAKLVIDHATGLMWQQGGSGKYMTFAAAQEYIKQLNREKFAGCRDWRLPTLEEAMSLMEPKENSAGLYIDPVFDKNQGGIWTADQEASGGAWYVSFYDGRYHLSVHGFNYVRAVRSGQS